MKKKEHADEEANKIGKQVSMISMTMIK